MPLPPPVTSCPQPLPSPPHYTAFCLQKHQSDQGLWARGLSDGHRSSSQSAFTSSSCNNCVIAHENPILYSHAATKVSHTSVYLGEGYFAFIVSGRTRCVSKEIVCQSGDTSRIWVSRRGNDLRGEKKRNNKTMKALYTYQCGFVVENHRQTRQVGNQMYDE